MTMMQARVLLAARRRGFRMSATRMRRSNFCKLRTPAVKAQSNQGARQDPPCSRHHLHARGVLPPSKVTFYMAQNLQRALGVGSSIGVEAMRKREPCTPVAEEGGWREWQALPKVLMAHVCC